MKCTKFIGNKIIQGILIPIDCSNEAVTFHGITTVTHGYCSEHRCCAKCGLEIKECKSEMPTERTDYLGYIKGKN